MARKRMIDPSFWRDEKIGELAFVDRLIFIGLWTFAEDNGAGRANPKLLKADILPYDDTFRVSDFEKSLEKLATLNLISLYKVNDQNYYHITNFAKHQTINRPTPTSIPLPTHEQVNERSNTTHGQLTLEKEEKEKINISLSAPAREERELEGKMGLLPGFVEFRKSFPAVQVDTCRIDAEYNFSLLAEKIVESEYLQQVTSLSWLLQKYPQIIAGKYKKLYKPKERKSTHFAGERKYTAEELRGVIANVDEIEI